MAPIASGLQIWPCQQPQLQNTKQERLICKLKCEWISLEPPNQNSSRFNISISRCDLQIKTKSLRSCAINLLMTVINQVSKCPCNIYFCFLKILSSCRQLAVVGAFLEFYDLTHCLLSSVRFELKNVLMAAAKCVPVTVRRKGLFRVRRHCVAKIKHRLH